VLLFDRCGSWVVHSWVGLGLGSLSDGYSLGLDLSLCGLSGLLPKVVGEWELERAF
jgi:hypothetical protein